MKNEGRIAELLSEMLVKLDKLDDVVHEQRALKEEMREMKEEQRETNRRLTSLETDVVALNAKQEATIEALERLRGAMIEFAHGSGATMQAFAELERRVALLEAKVL